MGSSQEAPKIPILRTVVHPRYPSISMAKRKKPAAVAPGRKGGEATAKSLTPKQRAEMARNAASARWNAAKKNPKGRGE
jgi:hypothetical protein